MSLFITTEATADCPEQLAAQFENFKIIPMGYSVNGTPYDGDKTKLTPKEFYDTVRQAKTKEDLPLTTMVTQFAAEEFFRPILAAGNDIIHLGFSQALSGTYDQIVIAAKGLKEEFPDRKITIINTRSASFIEGLLAYYTLLKRDSGASYDEIVDYVNELSNHAFAYFVVDDLNHLCRTGRASKAEAFMGSALKIKPILYCNNNGRLIPISKVMSKKKAIRGMFDMFKNKMLDISEQKIIGIGHSDCEDDANLLKKLIKDEFNVDALVLDIGPVIGTHVGAGMLALFFLGKDRMEKNDPEFKN